MKRFFFFALLFPPALMDLMLVLAHPVSLPRYFLSGYVVAAVPALLVALVDEVLASGGGVGPRWLQRSAASDARYCWRPWSAATSLPAAPLKSIANQSGQTISPATPAPTFCATFNPCSSASS